MTGHLALDAGVILAAWLVVGLAIVTLLCWIFRLGNNDSSDEPREVGKLIEVGHFGERRRSRADVRNGLGGGA